LFFSRALSVKFWFMMVLLEGGVWKGIVCVWVWFLFSVRAVGGVVLGSWIVCSVLLWVCFVCLCMFVQHLVD
jgi:hypothetical protein